MATRWIVWAPNKSEGIILETQNDVNCAIGREDYTMPVSSLADDWAEAWGDDLDRCTVEQIEI